eukprot:m.139845 g.139845  ORF g.139845 m.139845 type:complete len:404 (+) comp25073_c0_seq1:135-1346(+)
MKGGRVFLHRAVVAVGMSGGVDSTVAAMLLKKYHEVDVRGYFMRNWDEKEEGGKCRGEEEYAKVKGICRELDIPCHRVEFIPEYWNDVFMPTVVGYEQGITPNPDVLCNAKIKFSAFYDHVRKQGCDFLATGHYARVKKIFLDGDESFMLEQAADEAKDQTYFLAGTPSHTLSRVMFPLGDLHKSEVKQLACDAGLDEIAQQPESMGLCFIGKRPFQEFVGNYVHYTNGDVFDAESGKLLCKDREGALMFTIGQNARIGGLAKKYFVLDKDMITRTVRVVPGRDHPLLYSTKFEVHDVAWSKPTYTMSQLFQPFANHTNLSSTSTSTSSSSYRKRSAPLQVRVRHQGELFECHINLLSSDCLHGFEVISKKGIRAVAPGQSAVFYKDGLCLGRATIVNTTPAL